MEISLVKKIYDDQKLGMAEIIKIDDASEDLELLKPIKKPQPKIENIEEPLDILKEEEVITKDHKKNSFKPL